MASTTSRSRCSGSTSIHPADKRAFWRLFPESFGEVFLAAVGEDHDDEAGLERVGDSQARGKCGSAGDPDEQALLEGEALGQLIRLFGADAHVDVGQSRVVDAR